MPLSRMGATASSGEIRPANPHPYFLACGRLIKKVNKYDDSDYSTPEGDDYALPEREAASSEPTKRSTEPPFPQPLRAADGGGGDDHVHNNFEFGDGQEPIRVEQPVTVSIIDETSPAAGKATPA